MTPTPPNLPGRLRISPLHDEDGHFTHDVVTNLALADPGAAKPRRGRGSALIGQATALLFVVGAGLLAVSLAAQYSYVDRQRHQHYASLIEALALDALMLIFSLLALGLARAAKPAKVERALILICAAGSAVMNYAAADVASPRSVLAFVMPPLALAVVSDRVISVVRRFWLTADSERSAWSLLGSGLGHLARGLSLVLLYTLRFALDRKGTASGFRYWVLSATPLPTAETPVITTARKPQAITPARDPKQTSKTQRFIALVIEQRGPLADFPVADVSRTCAELAPEVDLDAGSARTALRKAVLAAQPADEEAI